MEYASACRHSPCEPWYRHHIQYTGQKKKTATSRSSEMVPFCNPARIVVHPPFVEVDTKLTHFVHLLGRSGHRLISQYCRLVSLCPPRIFPSFVSRPVSAIILLVPSFPAPRPPRLPHSICPCISTCSSLTRYPLRQSCLRLERQHRLPEEGTTGNIIRTKQEEGGGGGTSTHTVIPRGLAIFQRITSPYAYSRYNLPTRSTTNCNNSILPSARSTDL